MPLHNISPVVSHLKLKVGQEGVNNPVPFSEDKSASKSSFADMINDAINSVDDAQKTADQNVRDVVMGKSDNVAQVMISMQKAQLSFKMMAEIRNKVMQTYQELSRMQI